MTSSEAPRGGALGRAASVTRASLALVRESAPRQFWVSVTLQVSGAVLLGVQLFLVKELVAQLVGASDTKVIDSSAVVPVFAGLVIASIASGVAAVALEQQRRLMADLVAHHTMRRLIEVSTRVGLTRFEDPDFHDHLERARDAAMFRPIEMVNNLTTLLTSLLTSIGVTVALFTIEAVLVPLVALAAVPVLLASLHNSRQSYLFEFGMTVHAREHLHLMELLTGAEPAKELRVFSATGFLRDRYDKLTRERIVRLREFLQRRVKVSLLGTAATGLGTAIALGSLVWLLVTGRTSVANAAAGAFAMQLLASRLQQMTAATSSLVEGGLFLEDYRQFLAVSDTTEASPISGVPTLHPGHFEGLRVDGVSFTYPLTGRQVLEDVSLELRPGEVIALVGENGSGKTTLVKLLCRLYTEVDAGRILLNGHDLRELTPKEVREQFAVLFQDFVRYELTVEDNIILGRPDVPSSEARISGAARRAGAELLIDQLPSGYATRLGRRFHGGAELSGGQWQRLALARAFYRGGNVLILDEPTAALDPRAEAEFFRQVAELAADKSVILVSHRFSSVRTADRIYVLQDGRVIESGPHDDLISLNGVYAELYDMQVSAYFGADPRQD